LAPTKYLLPLLHPFEEGEVRRAARGPSIPNMRDIETIDSELRPTAIVRRTARELSGRTPSTALIDAIV
jgi:hypothetical protein